MDDLAELLEELYGEEDEELCVLDWPWVIRPFGNCCTYSYAAYDI